MELSGYNTVEAALPEYRFADAWRLQGRIRANLFDTDYQTRRQLPATGVGRVI